MSERAPEDLTDDDAEIVDALPVASGEGPRSTPLPSPPPARDPAPLPARTVPVAQAAAVAATGFAAGAVTAVVVRGVTKRRVAAKRQTKPRLPPGPTRSFLVDVHLLGSKE